MARAKKIKKEIKEAEEKANQIETEVDTNTVNIEAETIKDIMIEVYHKTYKISELIRLINKENKTYHETEVVKMFKELMRNYYRSIVHATLRNCCGAKYTIEDVKNKLKDNKTYEIIDIRCSRNYIRFNKETVDTIIDYIEKYEK